MRDEAERLAELARYLLDQLDRAVEIHAHVAMDTDEDQALHAKAVAALREAADKGRRALESEGGAIR